MKQLKRSESDVLSSVRLLLKARGILCFRRGVGKFQRHGAWMSFGVPGEADLEAIVRRRFTDRDGKRVLHPPVTVFIETKRLGKGGVQSDDQKEFQRMVEDYGCTYLLVKSADEVEAWLQENT